MSAFYMPKVEGKRTLPGLCQYVGNPTLAASAVAYFPGQFRTTGLVMVEFLQRLLWGAAAFAEDEDTAIGICSELEKNLKT